ncbi:hypothetical protein MIB92_00185 [Aestuariirhabdus sp. Z084]|uniref:3-hydroxyacyl-ACP dehydratase FabZ family protein n=1 Tax=Aestuariirhabdus haliotis TaxID=2918751 RepID=UPI00201B3ABF|nr:hypothetical protein [Aestuariirhabdus haliotis]MCL6414053.1 hypothetical protein [Aestuariirhabdus haliotis]MCL6417986.1 hypothetical protein [Aestuariirhabdus haliotis]
MKYPEQSIIAMDNNTATLVLKMSRELIWFAGHFPDQPVLPGVVQLQWAEHYAKEILSVTGAFSGMQRVKFQQLVLPGQHLELKLEYKRDKQQLWFQYLNAKGDVSSGRITLTESDH